MLFNSFPFILLVIITLVLYYNRFFGAYQVPILIISSFTFYAYSQPYLLFLLFVSASINAIVSYKVYLEKIIKKKKIYATIGVVFNLLVIIFFKYGPLFSDILDSFNSFNGIGEFIRTIPLPVGISFYTFQGISLVVDLFRDNPQKHILNRVNYNFKKHYFDTLFFISFFPQLVSGPIVKAYQFFPQIKQKYFKDIDLDVAIKFLILGYFLKMVIADNLKDQTFWMTYPYFQNYSSLTLLTLLFGYSMQIFSDFAGYSLIAIGIAKLFGYNLIQNFNFPYISKSFSEFWTRWHISLSTWLKEYLYIPIGGNRVKEIRLYINLYVVMLLGGLWHGAAWSYMVWGGYHGSLLAIEKYLMRFTKSPSIHFINIFKIFIVFSFVTFGWLLFKLPEFEQVILYIKTILLNDGARRIDIILNIFIYSFPVFIYHLNYYITQFQKGKYYLNKILDMYQNIF